MAVLVDHDHGGKDALAYRPRGGPGVERADVRVFRKSDWQANNRSARFLQGRTGTAAGGRWVAPVPLPSGDYVVVFAKPGLFGPDVVEVAVDEGGLAFPPADFTATPIAGMRFGAAPGGAADCTDQSTLTPQTPNVFGCDVSGRRRAVRAVQGQAVTLAWTFLDADGKPVDLSSCGDFDPDDATTGEVRVKIREAVSAFNAATTEVDVVGEVDDAAAGTATFALGEEATLLAGVYLAEAGVFNGDGALVFSNQLYLVVDRGLFGTTGTQNGGPPSLAMIRLHLRDSDPAESTLLETVQFDPAEIAAAIEYPILYWNEAPPPIPKKYNTNSFPARFHWLEAIVSRLYEMAAHWYRRNQANFQTQGGVGLDDLNKADQYERKAAQKWEAYKEWVKMDKVSRNAAACVGWTASEYSSGGW